MLLLASTRLTPFVLMRFMLILMRFMLVVVRFMLILVRSMLILMRFMLVVVRSMLIRFVVAFVMMVFVGQTDDIGGGLFDGAVCICG